MIPNKLHHIFSKEFSLCSLSAGSIALFMCRIGTIEILRLFDQNGS